MPEIDKILETMAKEVGKRKSDLKRTYNSIMKSKEEEGLKGVVAEDTLIKICLLGVCKKYELDSDLVETLLNQEEDEEEEPEPLEEEDEVIPGSEEIEEPEESPCQAALDSRLYPEFLTIREATGLSENDLIAIIDGKINELHGMITEEGALMIVGKDLGVDIEIPKKKPKKSTKKSKEVKTMGDSPWTDIFATTSDPDDIEFEDDGEKSFEELPNFKPMINVRYQMRLRDVDEAPYCHEDIGKDGKPYKSYAVHVTMVKKGDLDKKVKPGKGYTFWMSAALDDKDRPKLFDYFAKFWEEIGANPDDRVFEFLKTQKTGKSGRNYNIFEFKEA